MYWGVSDFTLNTFSQEMGTQDFRVNIYLCAEIADQDFTDVEKVQICQHKEWGQMFYNQGSLD